MCLNCSTLTQNSGIYVSQLFDIDTVIQVLYVSELLDTGTVIQVLMCPNCSTLTQ